jgi:hypothetical protein
MPQRRRVQKGSFASHFEDLVEHFAAEEEAAEPASRKGPRQKKRPLKHSRINQRLFERSTD